MNRLTPLISRPIRAPFDPSGVVVEAGGAWSSDLMAPVGNDLAADLKLFLIGWAAGLVFFGTLFA